MEQEIASHASYSRPSSEPVNSDSFLDIVASVVSIMIIMVVMEGTRIKNAPVKVAIPASPAAIELEKDLAAEQSLRGDVLKSADEISNLERRRPPGRAARRAGDDGFGGRAQDSGAAPEARRRASEPISTWPAIFRKSRPNWSNSSSQREQVENAPAPPVVVESYPTPISRAVDGPEAHLLIAHGRVVLVPLRAAVWSSSKRKPDGTSPSSSISRRLTETVGPVDGFRLRYTMERYDVTPETGRGSQPRRQLRPTAKVDGRFPTPDDLGEPVRLALEEGSDFRQHAGQDPARPDHHHHLGVSRRLRRLSPDSQGTVSAGLHDRRPAAAARHSYQRFAGREQVGGAITPGTVPILWQDAIKMRLSPLARAALEYIDRAVL